MKTFAFEFQNLGEKLKHLDAAVKDYKQAKEKLDDNEERIQRKIIFSAYI